MSNGKNLEKQAKYPQPHNIHINTGNETLDAREVEVSHARAKYNSKYYRSKKSKRNY